MRCPYRARPARLRDRQITSETLLSRFDIARSLAPVTIGPGLGSFFSKHQVGAARWKKQRMVGGMLNQTKLSWIDPQRVTILQTSEPCCAQDHVRIR
jgi:hypothetical protein